MKKAIQSIKEVIETISPILISPTTSSITLSLSKRFFLFNLMNKIINVIEEDPYLNFVALLKNYKSLGKVLYGTLHEFHRDRNKLYFKNFFYDRALYELVKEEIEDLYPKYKELKMTLTKKGVIIYDNYKKNSFNVLLLTVHSGSWIPTTIAKKMKVTQKDRYLEEDIQTDLIYRELVLQKGGIWINNKQSRFLIDFNRAPDRAIYTDHSEKWITEIWRHQPTKAEKDAIYRSYYEFYFTLAKLVESYHFNIIFDGHSMNHFPNRPHISFGTKFTPEFYMPIVRSMQQRMKKMDYGSVMLNTPYGGGNIPLWLSKKFPHMFIFSAEVNKRVYMSKDGPLKKRVEKLAQDWPKLFDIEEEPVKNRTLHEFNKKS